MADENIIYWNVENWITITAMALIAFAILGFGQKWYQNRNA